MSSIKNILVELYNDFLIIIGTNTQSNASSMTSQSPVQHVISKSQPPVPSVTSQSPSPTITSQSPSPVPSNLYPAKITLILPNTSSTNETLKTRINTLFGMLLTTYGLQYYNSNITAADYAAGGSLFNITVNFYKSSDANLFVKAVSSNLINITQIDPSAYILSYYPIVSSPAPGPSYNTSPIFNTAPSINLSANTPFRRPKAPKSTTNIVLHGGYAPSSVLASIAPSTNPNIGSLTQYALNGNAPSSSSFFRDQENNINSPSSQNLSFGSGRSPNSSSSLNGTTPSTTKYFSDQQNSINSPASQYEASGSERMNSSGGSGSVQTSERDTYMNGSPGMNYIPIGQESSSAINPTGSLKIYAHIDQNGPDFSGSTSLQDGRILLLPGNQPNIGIFDPESNKFIRIKSEPHDINAYQPNIATSSPSSFNGPSTTGPSANASIQMPVAHVAFFLIFPSYTPSTFTQIIQNNLINIINASIVASNMDTSNITMQIISIQSGSAIVKVLITFNDGNVENASIIQQGVEHLIPLLREIDPYVTLYNTPELTIGSIPKKPYISPNNTSIPGINTDRYSGSPITSLALSPSPSTVAGRKKGFVVGNSDPTAILKVIQLNSKWYYSWGPKPPGVLSGSVININKLPLFTPMVWNITKSPNIKTELNSLQVLNQPYQENILLGYNEPDGINQSDQGDMTVGQAVQWWPQLASTGRRLGSPVMYGSLVNAPNDLPGTGRNINNMPQPLSGILPSITINLSNTSIPNNVTLDSRIWLDNFLIQLSLIVPPVKFPDFITVHWYGPPNSRSFLNYLQNIYNKYHLPIWVTEYSVADWGATYNTDTNTTIYTAAYDWSYPTDQNITTNATAQFMRDTVAGMNAMSFVEHYSWKERFLLSPPGTAQTPNISVEGPTNPDVMGQSTLFESYEHFPSTLPSLTPLGQLYASL